MRLHLVLPALGVAAVPPALGAQSGTARPGPVIDMHFHAFDVVKMAQFDLSTTGRL